MVKRKRILILILFPFLFVFLTACGGSSKTGTIVGVRAMSNYGYAENLQNMNDVTLTDGLIVRMKNGTTVLAQCSDYKMLDLKTPFFINEYTIMDWETQRPFITIKLDYNQAVTIEKYDEYIWNVVKIEPID